MASAETLERFIARVEENAHAEAVAEFYTADGSMQENQSPPRVGRDAHVANEHRVLARAKQTPGPSVLRLVVGGSMAWAMAGVGVGIGAALGLLRFLGSLLYGVQPGDPVILGTVSLVLVCVALSASYLPARRAARIDPAVALGCD